MSSSDFLGFRRKLSVVLVQMLKDLKAHLNFDMLGLSVYKNAKSMAAENCGGTGLLEANCMAKGRPTTRSPRFG